MPALLEVEELRVRFETHHGTVRAVDGVSLELAAGETVGLVGESGSGKSVTSLALIGMIPVPPGVVEAKRIAFDGRDLLALAPDELRRIRGNEISMIFQDPMTSLNPFLTVGRQLSEVLEVHKGRDRREAWRDSARGLGDVGIPNPERCLDSFPHELSGGMRQRVMIAMALLCEPKILLADEPTTALDVTIQAQILELLKELQRRYGTAIILVTHALGVVAGMANRVYVMYAGRIVESAATGALFARPHHPYTEGLLRCLPTLRGDGAARLAAIDGQPPDLAALPPGCAFRPRCGYAIPRCEAEVPPLTPATLAAHAAEANARRSACFSSAALAAGAPAGAEMGRA
ncbi:MAG: ABC transporter ATP-binding protein [Planctomycetes bacterium]|nr:ABC transporter ATP-binding protein [Planctomycetota bacterium]